MPPLIEKFLLYSETNISLSRIFRIMNDMDLLRLHNSLVYYLVNMGTLDQIYDADEMTISVIKDMSLSYAA